MNDNSILLAWALLSKNGGGGGGGGQLYTTTITGDGTTTDFTITHNLNTQYGAVIVCDSSYNDVIVDIQRSTANAYILGFEEAPAAGVLYHVGIMATTGGGGGGSVAIDNKTIKKNAQNQLETAAGGWYDSDTSTYHTIDGNYIPVDGTTTWIDSEGKLVASTRALQPMKSAWKGAITTQAAATAILNDSATLEGDGFLGTVHWTDMPGDFTQAEVKAFVLKKETYQKIIQFELTTGESSSSNAPYAWYYNSYKDEWCTYMPLTTSVSSNSINIGLAASVGKTLQDQITNLQNIGRFLSIWDATTGLPTTDPTVLPYTYRTGDYYRVGKVGGGRYIHQIALNGTTAESTAYVASFGFINESNTAYSTFESIAQKLYELGYKTISSAVECSHTISGTTRSGFVYSPNSTGNRLVFIHYNDDTHEYEQDGTATSSSVINDNVSIASIHTVEIEGSSTTSQATYVDALSFPSTRSTAYTSVADIAQVLQKLNYSATYPCFCAGQVGTTSIYLCYGSGNELVLMDNINHEVGRIATATTINDEVTSSGLPNYKPTGTTYNGTPSTVLETEELEVGAVYYFDSEKWVLQKSGGGGKVQDVQINGTTIVAANTGIANIPIAGSELGVVKPGSGLVINSTTGSISVNKASNSAIEGKSEAYNPIVPANLDKAVMEGLGNNSLTWSDAYKTSARNTIGACSLQEYDPTAVSYSDGVLYYTVD